MVAARRLLPARRFISTLFAEAYASDERRGARMLVCRWQGALLANPRSGIRRTALRLLAGRR